MLDTAILSQAQREQYQRSGWVAVPGLVDSEWLERLRRVTDEFVDASREADRVERPVRPRRRAYGR